MLLKYFYDESLAHASYLVGCQRAKTALIVDPGRDIEPYLQVAQKEGLTIVGVAETHIHADYVSGARELADRVGAKLYVSDEGPADWKYEYASGYEHQLLKDGDSFSLGRLRFEVMHTPGHTPESISFLLTDQGGGANEPMGIFTGDFVFVGSIGRPDLLEEAAGVEGSADSGARELYRSVERFKQLPDYLQLWPAHGAGSACGKGLGAIPSSTVGYEKRFNPALQFDSEEEFVRYILADQPEAPRYFAVMKRVNKQGPAILGERPVPPSLDVAHLPDLAKDATLIDLSPSAAFAQAHVPLSINIPLPMLAQWAGWVVDYDRPVYLIASPAQLAEAMRVLHKIGLDTVQGAFDAQAVRQAGLANESYQEQDPKELASPIEAGEVTLIDVRSDAEWKGGRIPGAAHYFLGRLPRTLSQLPKDKPIVAQCQAGGRSAIACSLLQATGADVINMRGGIAAWRKTELPTTDSCSEGAACDVPSSTTPAAT